MRNFRPLSPIVFSPTADVVPVYAADVEELCGVAKGAAQKKSRILLHGTPQAHMHEMIIVHSSGQYIQPHINDNAAKSFTVLQGEMMVALFDVDGAISAHHHLGNFSGDQPFMLRLEKPVFHTVLATTPTVAFIETTLGPHSETRYAEFAPAADGGERATKYFHWLTTELGATI